jgi:hypothetical protein
MTLPGQLSIFDTLREPMIRQPVDPDGSVVQGKAQETFSLPHPRYVWDYAKIELHPAADGLWMWGVSLETDAGFGSGYKVGEKWGRFASSRDDALHFAVEEIKGRLANQSRDFRHCPSITKIIAWAESLKP